MQGSKKAAATQPSGFIGDMSEEQEKTLEEFKAYLLENKILEDTLYYDDYYLLRFLRARKFSLEKTRLMFENFLQWRAENKIDTILEDFQFDEEKEVREVYPMFHHQVDKLGRCIYYECTGRVKIDKLFEITSEDRLIKFLYQGYEYLINFLMPACSAAAGKRVEQTLCVVDLQGFSMKMMNKKTYGLIQLSSKIGQDYYPEIMGEMYIINAPMIFQGVWKICKAFIDEKTRKKIKILGNKYKQELLNVIDEDKLPSIFGGTCTCENLGGCQNSDFGPWNDYELIKPWGIRKKFELSPSPHQEKEGSEKEEQSDLQTDKK